MKSALTLVSNSPKVKIESTNESEVIMSKQESSEEINQRIKLAEQEAANIVSSANEYRDMLISQTEVQVANMIKDTQNELTQSVEESKKQGYELGFEEGVIQGKDHGWKEVESNIQQSSKLVEEAHQYKSSIIAEAEPFLVELSVAIARRIIGEELKCNEEVIISVVQQAMTRIENMKRVSLCVHPEQFHYIQKNREEWLKIVSQEIEVKIILDRKVSFGSCLIRSDEGTIDAEIEVQLSNVKDELMSIALGSGSNDTVGR